MAVEAVTRVIRTGGDAARMLEGLNRQAREALANLEHLNPAVAQSGQLWRGLHEQLQHGGALNVEEQERYRMLSQSLRDLATSAVPLHQDILNTQAARRQRLREMEGQGIQPDVDRTYGELRQREIELQRRFETLGARRSAPTQPMIEGPPEPTTPAPERAAVAPPQAELTEPTTQPLEAGAGSAPRASRSPRQEETAPMRPEVVAPTRRLTTAAEEADEQFQEYVQRTARWNRGQLAQERARLEARLTPEALAVWGGEESEEARELRRRLEAVREAEGFRAADREERAARGGRAPVDPWAMGAEARGIAIDDDDNRRRGYRLRLDRELTEQWRDQQRILREQQETIRRTEHEYVDLDDTKREHLQQLRDERQETLENIRAIEAVHRERGLRPTTGELAPVEPAAGGVRRFMGDLLAGGGIGGGSIGGTLAGAAVGNLAWSRALPIMIGLMVARIVAMAQQAYSVRAEALMSAAIPTAMMAGGGEPMAAFEDLTRAGAMGMRYGFRPSELLAARRQFARQTAMGNLYRTTVAPVARLTGQDVGDEANAIASLIRVSTGRRDPYLSARLLAAYGSSRLPEAAPGRLGMTTYLYPQFVQAVTQLTEAMGTAFTRAPAIGGMTQLQAMTDIPIAGVEPHSQAALDIASARMQTANRFYGAGGLIDDPGMLGDLAYFAVRQLRNDPEVVRALRQVDPTINLNTMLGVYRAARRAPEFAARAAADPRLRALGRIGLAERGAFRGAFPERGMRELVALNAAQGDPEAAYFLANEEDLGRVYGARAAVSGRGMGRRAADRLADISREQVREPAVQYAIQAAVVPEVISITNEALARVGRDVQEIGNLISEKVGNGFNSIQAMIGDRLDRDIPLTPGATREHLQ